MKKYSGNDVLGNMRNIFLLREVREVLESYNIPEKSIVYGIVDVDGTANDMYYNGEVILYTKSKIVICDFNNELYEHLGYYSHKSSCLLSAQCYKRNPKI
jgi:hypothetical protein